MRRFALAVLSLFVVSAPPALAAVGDVTEFAAPSGQQPRGITAGPDGNLWYAGTADIIGRITTTGTITTFTGATSSSQPRGITEGPDGNLWFTEGNANKVGRITPTGTITEFATSGVTWGITAGPDGNVWFTELFANKIGRVTPAGVVTEFTAANTPNDIVTGSDGNLWFTEQGGKIGQMTPTGTLTEFVVPTASNNPYGITAGPDGNLWFTEAGSTPKIGRITTAGVFTEFPASAGTPWEIAAGPDGNLWFTYGGAAMIGRMTTAGVLTDFPVVGAGGLYGIAPGPDGNMWFTDSISNEVGFIETGFVPAPPPSPPPSGGGSTTTAPTTTASAGAGPTAATAAPPPTTAPPPPRSGQSGNLQLASGTVCVAVSQKSACVLLGDLRSIPVGSVIDATQGEVTLTVSAGRGKFSTGTFGGGKFRFTQVWEPAHPGPGLRLVTRLTLVGGDFSVCPGRKSRTAASPARRRVVRYLAAKASGAFRVVGSESSGIERGTQWKTSDLCEGTLTKVQEGAVVVSDVRAQRKVVVTAGKNYLAAR